MAHLQYMPGDPRLVDQLVYELKSKGIFDQFRKECIADVDTRPAYQNLRQRVESSVSSFLSRQCWKPDLNKNQLREKLRKHILDGNYLEQGVERIVDQVVNPKVASVFIPQVEDLVYNYLGITRKKTTPTAETSTEKTADLLPTDLEAVSPGSVKSNDDKQEEMDTDMKDESMDIDQEVKEIKEDSSSAIETEKDKIEVQETHTSGVNVVTIDSDSSIDKSAIPLPEEIKPENIPPPDNSPPKLDLGKIELPKEPNEYSHLPQNPTEIPLPDEILKIEKEQYFKPITLHSEDDDSSSDSSLRRNMSPLTPIRNFNNENSCDAQQAFEHNSDSKNDVKKEPSSFRFAIDSKSSEDSTDAVKPENKDTEQANLSHQFNNQVNINTFNTPLYEDSSNSNNLQIDYESDANSKINLANKPPDVENSEDSKKERKPEEKRSSHKSSHRSRDSHRHSNSKDRRSDSKQSNSRDSSRPDKKSKDDHSKSKSNHKERERSRDRNVKKESRDSSKHRSSHKSSSNKDSKSHRSSSSSQKHSSNKSDDKKTSSSHKDKNDKSSDKSKDKAKDTKSNSNRSDKDRKSSSKTKSEDKDKKKDKKEADDHYSLSGRGNHSRRSTDRDSNDGSSSSKGSNLPTSSKSSESKKETKGTNSKSDNTSTSGESTSPSDKEHLVTQMSTDSSNISIKPIVRVETHLEQPISSPPRLPFVPDVTLKKPKFAANFEEAKRMMKMRKFLDEEQKRMNQEAALLLEFQANVRPSLSQVYSSIPGPELEFACVSNTLASVVENPSHYEVAQIENINNNDIKDNVQDTNIIVIDNSKPIGIENLNKTVEWKDSPVIEHSKVTDTEGVLSILMERHPENINTTIRDITNEDISCNKHIISQEVEKATIERQASDTKGENCEVTREMMRIHELEPSNNETIVSKSMDDADNIDNQNDGENMKDLKNESYEENKPFSKLVEEITEYSKASERMKLNDRSNESVHENNRAELFEVTIITEELSEQDEPEIENANPDKELHDKILNQYPDENLLHYFPEHEKYDAEIENNRFGNFLKTFIENSTISNRMYLINCDSYEENVIRDVSQNFGDFEIINYYKNGHLKLTNNTKNIVKNVDLEAEVILPVDNTDFESPKSLSPVFSPVKSECSFELSSDYDARLEEMVNKTSRQEVMEIILGSVIDDSPTKMPRIDYCMDSNIEEESPLKRKMSEVESSVNNNMCILTPNKMRKLSESDQISSTTEETEEVSNNNRPANITRSKYLGRAKRVGLPRPKRSTLPNSPSSDKSVENYEHNTPPTPNGKIRMPTRNKVQRYDTSDLYKPKLHYLSRRNNIT